MAERPVSRYIQRRVPVSPETAPTSPPALTAPTALSTKRSTYLARRMAPEPEATEAEEPSEPATRKVPYPARRTWPEAAAGAPRLSFVDFGVDAKGTGGRSVRGSIHGEGQHVMHTLEELTAERDIEPSISPERVLLNIYDLGDSNAIQRLNVLLKPLGGGAFHAAVQLQPDIRIFRPMGRTRFHAEYELYPERTEWHPFP
ncbi:unnamed protein product [Effrenium voratum]|nr:unnamed protein product [Effrenium voratum]